MNKEELWDVIESLKKKWKNRKELDQSGQDWHYFHYATEEEFSEYIRCYDKLKVRFD